MKKYFLLLLSLLFLKAFHVHASTPEQDSLNLVQFMKQPAANKDGTLSSDPNAKILLRHLYTDEWEEDFRLEHVFGVNRNPAGYISDMYFTDSSQELLLTGKLDFSNSQELTGFVTWDHMIDSLDFRHCGKFDELNANSGYVKYVNLTGCALLNAVFIKGNPLPLSAIRLDALPDRFVYNNEETDKDVDINYTVKVFDEEFPQPYIAVDMSEETGFHGLSLNVSTTPEAKILTDFGVDYYCFSYRDFLAGARPKITLSCDQEVSTSEVDIDVTYRVKNDFIPLTASTDPMLTGATLVCYIFTGDNDFYVLDTMLFDGSKYYLDLPEGEYILSAKAPGHRFSYYTSDGSYTTDWKDATRIPVKADEELLPASVTLKAYGERDSLLLVNFMKQTAKNLDGTPSVYPNAKVILGDAYTPGWEEDFRLEQTKNFDWDADGYLTQIGWTSPDETDPDALYLAGNMDFSGCKRLQHVVCWGNMIDTMDFSNCEVLYSVLATSGPLKSINLTGCPDLGYAELDNNQLALSDVLWDALPNTYSLYGQNVGKAYSIKFFNEEDPQVYFAVDMNAETTFHGLPLTVSSQPEAKILTDNGVSYYCFGYRNFVTGSSPEITVANSEVSIRVTYRVHSNFISLAASTNPMLTDAELVCYMLAGENDFYVLDTMTVDGSMYYMDVPEGEYILSAEAPGYLFSYYMNDGSYTTDWRKASRITVKQDGELPPLTVSLTLRPEQYNEHDSLQLVGFLKQYAKTSDGSPSSSPNAAILLDGYTAEWEENFRPEKVGGTTWDKNGNLTGINWPEQDGTDLFLSGNMDFSGCLSLKSVTCEESMIDTANLTNCAQLNAVAFNSGTLASINLKGCPGLDDVNLDDNRLAVSAVLLDAKPIAFSLKNQEVDKAYVIKFFDDEEPAIFFALDMTAETTLLQTTMDVDPDPEARILTENGIQYYCFDYRAIVDDNRPEITVTGSSVDVTYRVDAAFVNIAASTVPMLPDVDLVCYMLSGENDFYVLDTMAVDGSMYYLEVPEGKYLLSAEADGYLFTYYTEDGTITADWNTATRITVKADEEFLPVTVKMEVVPELTGDNITISGQLIDDSQLKAMARPFKNSTVLLYSNKPLKSTTNTWYLVMTVKPDEITGRYSFTGLPAGTYMVKVEIAGYVTEGEDFEIVATSGNNYPDRDFVIDKEIKTIKPHFPSVTATPEMPVPEIVVYPNPATQLVHITGMKGEYTVKVINMAGQIVLLEKSTVPMLTLDMSGMPAGMYLIRVESTGNKVITSKIVKE